MRPARIQLEPKMKARKLLFQLMNSVWYQRFILFAIILQVILLACEYYGEPAIYGDVLSEFIFSTILQKEVLVCFEMVMMRIK